MPDSPTKYIIRKRNGKPILVDEQILRWRKECKKNGWGPYAKTSLDALGSSRLNDQASGDTSGRGEIRNIFQEDSDG